MILRVYTPERFGMPLANTIDEVTGILEKGNALVLTGAGLSTASGIPAYRDENGQWSHPPPMQASTFYRSEAARKRYWARSLSGWARISAAQPNHAHQAIATLQRHQIVDTIITQNVDGLHQKAGSQRVIDLHGNLSRVVCRNCACVISRASVQRQLLTLNPSYSADSDSAPAPDGDSDTEPAALDPFQIPACRKCNGVLKPDVVFFGENVPAERVSACFDQLATASSLICIGSSLMVFSGFRFCREAHRRQQPIVILNQGRTRADDIATIRLPMDCSDALTEITQRLCDPAP